MVARAIGKILHIPILVQTQKKIELASIWSPSPKMCILEISRIQMVSRVCRIVLVKPNLIKDNGYSLASPSIRKMIKNWGYGGKRATLWHFYVGFWTRKSSQNSKKPYLIKDNGGMIPCLGCTDPSVAHTIRQLDCTLVRESDRRDRSLDGNWRRLSFRLHHCHNRIVRYEIPLKYLF